MPSQVFQISHRLYAEMDNLGSTISIVSDGWNDRVADAIKGNLVSRIIERCNYVNQSIQALGQQIDYRLQQMESLLASINNY